MVHYSHNTDISIHIFNGNLFPPDYLKSEIMEHNIKLYQMFLNPKPCSGCFKNPSIVSNVEEDL